MYMYMDREAAISFLLRFKFDELALLRNKIYLWIALDLMSFKLIKWPGGI